MKMVETASLPGVVHFNYMKLPALRATGDFEVTNWLLWALSSSWQVENK